MQIFLIFTKNNDDNDVKIIKSGYSIMAGMFNFLWSIYHGLWLVAGIIILLTSIFTFYNMNTALAIFQFAQIIIFYMFSEEMLSYSLEKKNYRLSDIIYARDKHDAEYKFIKRNNKNDQLRPE